MPVTLTQTAVEKSTFIVTASFFDENDDPAVPSALTWTLTDQFGVVMNDRANQAVTPIGNTAVVVLHGNDLMLPDKSRPKRLLTFQGTYDSSLGSLEIKDAMAFEIVDLAAIL